MRRVQMKMRIDKMKIDAQIDELFDDDCDYIMRQNVNTLSRNIDNVFDAILCECQCELTIVCDDEQNIVAIFKTKNECDHDYEFDIDSFM